MGRLQPGHTKEGRPCQQTQHHRRGPPSRRSWLVAAMARGQGAGAERVRGLWHEDRKGSGLDLEDLVGPDFKPRLSPGVQWELRGVFKQKNDMHGTYTQQGSPWALCWERLRRNKGGGSRRPLRSACRSKSEKMAA